MNLIVTKDLKGGMRHNSTIPWLIPEEREYFDKLTTLPRCLAVRNVIIMGRYTWESLKAPLENRINIIVSTKIDYLNGIQSDPNLFVSSSIKEAIGLATSFANPENIWLIGGRSIYENCFKYCRTLFYIDIQSEYNCNVFFPELDISSFSKIVEDYDYSFCKQIFTKYSNINEEQYLTLVRKVLTEGKKKDNTLSVFGGMYEYDLTDNKIPLLTTKKMFWRAIVEELMWFVRGETNNKVLTEKGINIWTPNSKTEDLGPIYGFQWRYSGTEYIDCYTDYKGRGIDQLEECINSLKYNKTSRRIIIDSWNPKDLRKMALPPCHCLVQFYVNDDELSTIVYQRSGDVGLGIPFNIASYSLLTHMVAKLTNLKAKKFIHMIGDCHIYNNHIDGLKEQLLRQPNKYPTVEFLKVPEKIDDFLYGDIKLNNYDCFDSIPLQINV
jgi:thymidylate synthase